MIHISAVSDYNYLLYGLSLRDSIEKHTNERFVIHYLAIDEKTENFLKDIPNVKVYSIKEIKKDPMFEVLKKHNPPVEGDPEDHSAQYQYALASFFTHYLMRNKNLEHCLYIDCDIMFYADIKNVIDSVKNKDVGLIIHKHLVLDYMQGPGYYNVGIVYFSNSEKSLECLDFWRWVAADKSNQFFKRFGTCGDQKYLELFDIVIDDLKLKIIDEEIGHAAPWNFYLSWLDNEENLCWDAGPSMFGTETNGKNIKTQELMFIHFSHFRPKFESNTYKEQFNAEWGNILGDEWVKKLYDEYFENCKKIKIKYGL